MAEQREDEDAGMYAKTSRQPLFGLVSPVQQKLEQRRLKQKEEKLLHKRKVLEGEDESQVTALAQ